MAGMTEAEDRRYRYGMFARWLRDHHPRVYSKYIRVYKPFHEEGEKAATFEPELYATWLARQRLGVGD